MAVAAGRGRGGLGGWLCIGARRRRAVERCGGLEGAPYRVLRGPRDGV